jgi:PAS domain S-box-containing protein
MEDERKTKEELIGELIDLRRRNEKLEADINDLRQAEEKLRESEEKFRALFEGAAEGIIVADIKSRKFLYANPRICQMLGYTEMELKSMGMADVHPKDSFKYVISEFEAQVRGEKILAKNIPFLRKDGTVIYADVNSSKILVEGKECNVGFFTDVTEQKRMDEELKASLEEKEVLLKEIHHRVKNNMQIISSLLRLQAANIKDEKIQEVFNEVHGRIRSMSLLYEMLYQSKDLARVNFAEYIKRLTSHLISMHKVEIAAPSLRLGVSDVHLDIKRAIPCGLIITELVSNSLKHAFPNGRKGEIVVEMHPNKEEKYKLVVSDNGVGFPEGLDFRQTKSLGMRLVVDLVNQLNGTIELRREGGTEFRIEF